MTVEAVTVGTCEEVPDVWDVVCSHVEIESADVGELVCVMEAEIDFFVFDGRERILGVLARVETVSEIHFVRHIYEVGWSLEDERIKVGKRGSDWDRSGVEDTMEHIWKGIGTEGQLWCPEHVVGKGIRIGRPEEEGNVVVVIHHLDVAVGGEIADTDVDESRRQLYWKACLNAIEELWIGRGERVDDYLRQFQK